MTVLRHEGMAPQRLRAGDHEDPVHWAFVRRPENYVGARMTEAVVRPRQVAMFKLGKVQDWTKQSQSDGLTA